MKPYLKGLSFQEFEQDLNQAAKTYLDENDLADVSGGGPVGNALGSMAGNALAKWLAKKTKADQETTELLMAIGHQFGGQIGDKLGDTADMGLDRAKGYASAAGSKLDKAIRHKLDMQ